MIECLYMATETKRAIASPMSAGRIPPQNLESEVALLGAILLNPETLHDIITRVKPTVFYSDRHKTIFQSMLDLYSNGKPIDLVSLSSHLRDTKQIERCGGNSYIAQLVDAVPSAANIEHYADIVVKHSTMRSLIQAAERVVELGYSASEELESILDQAEKTIFNVTNMSINNTVHQVKNLLGETWEQIEKMHSSDSTVRGVPSGFPALDAKLSGFQPSDLIILAARPSVGKTSLALDIVRHAAIRENTAVAFFSLEMSAQQLIQRMLSAEASVDAWKLRTGKSSSEDFGKIQEAMGTLGEAPIFIDDKPANNIVSMRSVCRRLKSENNLGLIVVDYLQLMMPTASKNSDNVVQQVTEISRSLKALAREVDVPVIALSQLSRAVEQRGGKPRLSDLRDSGSIEQDADVVMFIHREDRYKEESEQTNIAEILIEKHRNGPTGTAQLYFDATRSSYLPLDKNHEGSSIDSF